MKNVTLIILALLTVSIQALGMEAETSSVPKSEKDETSQQLQKVIDVYKKCFRFPADMLTILETNAQLKELTPSLEKAEKNAADYSDLLKEIEPLNARYNRMVSKKIEALLNGKSSKEQYGHLKPSEQKER